MNNFLISFFSGLSNSAFTIVSRVLLALGFSTVTYTGLFLIINQVSNYFQLQITGLPADVLSMLGLMKIDIAFTMILSSVTAKVTLTGWTKLTDRKVSPFKQL